MAQDHRGAHAQRIGLDPRRAGGAGQRQRLVEQTPGRIGALCAQPLEARQRDARSRLGGRVASVAHRTAASA